MKRRPHSLVGGRADDYAHRRQKTPRTRENAPVWRDDAASAMDTLLAVRCSLNGNGRGRELHNICSRAGGVAAAAAQLPRGCPEAVRENVVEVLGHHAEALKRKHCLGYTTVAKGQMENCNGALRRRGAAAQRMEPLAASMLGPPVGTATVAIVKCACSTRCVGTVTLHGLASVS